MTVTDPLGGVVYPYTMAPPSPWTTDRQSLIHGRQRSQIYLQRRWRRRAAHGVNGSGRQQNHGYVTTPTASAYRRGVTQRERQPGSPAAQRQPRGNEHIEPGYDRRRRDHPVTDPARAAPRAKPTRQRETDQMRKLRAIFTATPTTVDTSRSRMTQPMAPRCRASMTANGT